MSKRLVAFLLLSLFTVAGLASAQPADDSLAARGGKRQRVAAFMPMQYAGKALTDDVLGRLDDRLWKEAFDTKAFKLVERARLAEVMEEEFIDRHTPVDTSKAARLGKTLKAELVALVTIELPTDEEDREVRARISCRMVNVGTKRIEMYGVGEGVATKGREYKSWDDARIAAGLKAIENVVADTFAAKGEILGVESPDEIRISIGSMVGIKEGTVLGVYGETNFDPRTGVTPGRYAGVMLVATEQVGPATAICRIYLTPEEERELRNKPEDRNRLIDRRFRRLDEGDVVKVGARPTSEEGD
jgi:hypothetical protein